MINRRIQIFLLSLLVIQKAYGGCSVSSGGMNFGVYMSPMQTEDLLSTGNINLNCDNSSIGASSTIHLSSGQSSNYLSRYLSNGRDSLFYNLYLSSSRDVSSIWGDGTGVTKNYSWTSQATDRITVFGKIPKGQNVSPGSYIDSVQVTVTF